MLYLITGKANSGKTTYAKNLTKILKAQGHQVYLLDADNVRKKRKDRDFTRSGRRDHIMAMAQFGSLAEDQGMIVIIACIAPVKEWRYAARVYFKKSKVIYVRGGTLWKNTVYERPGHLELSVP